MGFMATLCGGGLGLCLQLYSNGVRKLPLLRHPWEHVFFTGVGAWGMTKLIDWEAGESKKLDAMLIEMGRPTTGRE